MSTTQGTKETGTLEPRPVPASGRTNLAATIVGLGYVGLPLAAAFHESGFRVVGIDADPKKVQLLTSGTQYLRHLGRELPRQLSRSARFRATNDFHALPDADIVIVCVPTPLGPHREPDLSYVLQTAEEIGKRVRPGQLVVLESTTYPGTTRDEFAPIILEGARSRGLQLEIGRNIYIAYSPEREDPGRQDFSTSTIPKLVGGLDPVSGRLAADLYRHAVANIVEVESAEIAESAKLLENIFRSVNIALVNELKVILDKMNIDVWEVIRAASTKPFGFMPFYPGPGLGGHCIPIDPFYLSWKAQEIGSPTRFIQLAGEINTSMPHYVVERLATALSDRGKPLSGSSILIIGLAYKPDVDDTRESPAFEIIQILHERKVKVSYHDPYLPVAPQVRRHSFDMKSIELTPETVAGFDAVLIVTNHSKVDYGLLADSAQLVVDTRDVMRPFAGAMKERLVRA